MQDGSDLKPSTAFMDAIRRIDSGNALRSVNDLVAVVSQEAPSRRHTIVRQLDAVAFRLEGLDRFEAASRVHDLIASVDENQRGRREVTAAGLRLQGLCEDHRFGEAAAFVEALRGDGVSSERSLRGVEILMALAWRYECRYQAEPAVQCYRLAHALGDGSGIVTPDGHALPRKIRDIRNLQLTALLEQGRQDEAAPLHDETRGLLGLGPIQIYEIVSVRAAAADGRGVYHEVLPGRRIAEPAIRFLDGPVSLKSEAGTLDAPPQYVATFRDCLAFPRSNVVLHGDRLIYDLAAHPLSGRFDLRDGVNPDQIFFAAYGAGRALVAVPPEVREIDAGLMLFGLQSGNYGHWLLEYVSRMLWFNDGACPDGFPICIDDHMPDTHRQIIALMDERSRPVLPLPAIPIRVRELGVAPVPTFFPFDIRAGFPVYDAIWPRDVLGAMRCKILERLAARGLNLQQTGRRLFLSRQGYGQRQLVNEAEIADILSRHGFEVVHPERLSFSEQVELYHAAEIVVGSASSALYNCLFCRPGTQIIALIHEELSFPFRGFTSAIESFGAQLLFIRGTTLPSDAQHRMHASFTVQPEKVVAGLGAIVGH